MSGVNNKYDFKNLLKKKKIDMNSKLNFKQRIGHMLTM